MIYIYASETAEWFSTIGPTAAQLRDLNLDIWRVGPDKIELYERLWPARHDCWVPKIYAGAHRWYIYRGIWGNSETRYSTTWQYPPADVEIYRITVKPGFAYEYKVDVCNNVYDETLEWRPMDQRETLVPRGLK